MKTILLVCCAGLACAEQGDWQKRMQEANRLDREARYDEAQALYTASLLEAEARPSLREGRLTIGLQDTILPHKSAIWHGNDRYMQNSGLYESVGGAEGCRKLSETFYARVEHDPVLRPLFPAASFRCAIEALASFLAQFLGGPCEYADKRWSLSLREAHLRFKIGEKERTAWLKNMRRALEDAGIEEPARGALFQFFEQESARLVNHPNARPNLPAAGPMRGEIAERLAVHRGLEEAVAAVRRGAPGSYCAGGAVRRAGLF